MARDQPEASRHAGNDNSPHTYLLFVNGRRVSPDYVLCEGDEVAVLPRSMQGEAPMPSRRLFVKHLAKTFGMQRVKGPSPRGKGDHEKWRHPDGWSIDVNPGRRDHKEVDKASVADLARKLGLPFGKVYHKVMQPI